MPRSAEQNEQIRETTRAEIVAGAMRLFAQNGYAHTTTRAIAGQAGISTGLMYHYFDSKEALLEAVFESCMAILSQAFAEAYTAAEPGRRIAGLLRSMFDLLERDRDFWALFYMMRGQPSVMELLGDSFRLWTTRLRDLFVAEFTCANHQEPILNALLLYSLVEGTIQQYLLDPDNYPLAAVTERIISEFGTQNPVD